MLFYQFMPLGKMFCSLFTINLFALFISFILIFRLLLIPFPNIYKYLFKHFLTFAIIFSEFGMYNDLTF